MSSTKKKKARRKPSIFKRQVLRAMDIYPKEQRIFLVNSKKQFVTITAEPDYFSRRRVKVIAYGSNDTKAVFKTIDDAIKYFLKRDKTYRVVSYNTLIKKLRR